METIRKKSWLTLCAVLTFAFCSNSAFCKVQENQANDILVGRIAYIEGQLLRYMPDEDDWVLTDVDTPFGQYDNLFSSEDGKAEIIMPNNTLLRIGGDTQVQLIELTNEVTETDISSGTARLYNKSSSVEIKATTPFGDVIMPPDSVCDIYVHENQAEVVSLKARWNSLKQAVKPGMKLLPDHLPLLSMLSRSLHRPRGSYRHGIAGTWPGRPSGRSACRHGGNQQNTCLKIFSTMRLSLMTMDAGSRSIMKGPTIITGGLPM